LSSIQINGAGDGTRTRDVQLGRLELYQLSYTRNVPPPVGGGGRIRTFEVMRRQIYSLLPLATREPLRGSDTKNVELELAVGLEPATF
jgi:hypothetical protein